MVAIAGNPKHVVVLMFENRSFDHLFGAFPGVNGVLSADDGLKPEIYNLPQPTQPPSDANPKQPPIQITPDVALQHDFNHNFGNGMMQELYGPGTTGVAAGQPINAPPRTWPAVNSGFYSTIAHNVAPPSPINGTQSLSYYKYGSLQVLHQIAAQFVLCDNWFCDMPADTLLNRYFMHGAQTAGYISDNQGGVFLNAPTIFDQIEAAGLTWKMYAPWAIKDGDPIPNPQIDSRFLNPHIQDSPNTGLPVTQFAADAAAGTLPFYSFLMCWLPPGTTTSATDTSMHPASDIRPGENYLAAVYAALRSSPAWNDTLLIVTFDENGGVHDHVAPPVTVAPNSQTGSDWDPYLETEVTFDFTVLGPRIPALLISPWLRSGVATGQYQNTSILRLLEELSGAAALNARDAQAPSLDAVFGEFGLSQPRTDCPPTFTPYPDLPYSNGDLSVTYVVPKGAHITPPRYMESLAKIYRLDEA